MLKPHAAAKDTLAADCAFPAVWRRVTDCRKRIALLT